MKETPVDTLIKALAALPGLGPRSARRIALHLLSRRKETLMPMIRALQQACDTIRTCEVCGNLDLASPCRICQDPARMRGVLCIVSGVADLWAIERTGAYKGLYHVLGGVLSALDGVRPDDLRIDSLIARLKREPAKEVILALSVTVDGQATAHYVSDRIADCLAQDTKITRLAQGVPVGGELDYLDEGTITTALKSRAAL